MYLKRKKGFFILEFSWEIKHTECCDNFNGHLMFSKIVIEFFLQQMNYNNFLCMHVIAWHNFCHSQKALYITTLKYVLPVFLPLENIFVVIAASSFDRIFPC